jgi:hypothetical protein
MRRYDLRLAAARDDAVSLYLPLHPHPHPHHHSNTSQCGSALILIPQFARSRTCSVASTRTVRTRQWHACWTPHCRSLITNSKASLAGPDLPSIGSRDLQTSPAHFYLRWRSGGAPQLSKRPPAQPLSRYRPPLMCADDIEACIDICR